MQIKFIAWVHPLLKSSLLITPLKNPGIFFRKGWNENLFMFTLHAAWMSMCKSELVRDGDFPCCIIYSYLFVGVGLAQKFKPITIFTREFSWCFVYKQILREHGKLHNFWSLLTTLLHFFISEFLSYTFQRLKWSRRKIISVYLWFERREKKSLCMLMCGKAMMKIYEFTGRELEKK